MSDLARALLDELAADPVALDRLRELVAHSEVTMRPSAPAYTVATLATELGRSERSIRAAIARGELAAVKRGRGYVIGADAVARWAQAPPQRRRARSATRGPGLSPDRLRQAMGGYSR